MKYDSTYDILVDIAKILDNGGGGGANVVEVTQSEYDNIEVKDENIIYLVTDAEITQEKSVEYTENGKYTVLPDEGYYLTGVNVDVNVKGSGGGVVFPNGTKFRTSTFTTFPEGCDFSQISSFDNMFYECRSLTTIPQLDTSNGTNFSGMFYGCPNLTTIPQLYVSNGTNFSSMFRNCSSLTKVPQLDTSNGTNFGGMFINCSSLTEVPLFNTSNSTNFNGMFSNCSSLTEVPLFNTSNGTDFGGMFNGCSSLTKVPQIDVSKGIEFIIMFADCTSLTTIQQLDLSNGTNFSNMFRSCKSLTNITLTGSINYNIDFSSCTKLTYDSVKSILTACAATTNTSSKTLKFNRTLTDNNGELAALVTACTSKSWTISGLSLN